MGLNLLKRIAVVWAFASAASFAGAVAVHDPSVVLVYKDAAGNSYPEQDALKSRTKYYYVFGTQGGAAYSKDLLNWTEFVPKYSVNGAEETDYSKVIAEAAAWSGHLTADEAKGNYWAPDIIWNKSLGKWCLYYSENGDDWMSSIGMLVSDKIEGPYEFAGTVVFGGMDSGTSGAGNDDYKKVTGSSTVATRYYMRNNGTYSTGWDGGYGVSCIDPNVFYDRDGNLWLAYGSWSGGIFLLKLDPKTGLRDYGQTYGSGGEALWDGAALKSDPYMGIHIAGGYYVSGEGSYIEYMEDADGNGFYYLFISYGFYSPDGGYSMRVFRSKDVTGPYADVTGDGAIFSQYIYNYGKNVTYGFPIVQGYRFSFWDEGNGEIADGHNSLLTDDDGRHYVVYHRKYTNGTAWHNVEVHELVFNKNGWVVALPFEHRTGYGLPDSSVGLDEIAGQYRIIVHEGQTQADNSYPVNTEKELYLNADGTLSGAYTGTWDYDFAGGRHYISLSASGTSFEGALAVQLENDVSKRTLTFSAMDAAGELALWGYRVPGTEVLTVRNLAGDSVVTVGKEDFSTAWDSYEEFLPVSVPDSFSLEFRFKNRTQAENNWNNWILSFKNGDETWYLRADAYSVETFSGSSVGYKGSWDGDWDAFRKMFQNADVTLKARRLGTTIDVFAFVGDSLVYRASATGTPSGDYTVYLGADEACLEVSKVAYGANSSRILVGAIDGGGVYTSAFNTELSPTYAAPSGDFSMKFRFANYGNGDGAEAWDNFIIREISGSNTMLLRADVYALDGIGQTEFTKDWDFDDFAAIMRNASVDLEISRVNDTIAFAAEIVAENGDVYHYGALQTGAPTGDVSFGFSVEKSAVDLFGVETVENVGVAADTATTAISRAKRAALEKRSLEKVRDRSQILLKTGGRAYRLNGSRFGR